MIYLQNKLNQNLLKILSHFYVISKALDDLSNNMIMSFYWVISTINQKKKNVEFPKNSSDLFQKSVPKTQIDRTVSI